MLLFHYNHINAHSDQKQTGNFDKICQAKAHIFEREMLIRTLPTTYRQIFNVINFFLESISETDNHT